MKSPVLKKILYAFTIVFVLGLLTIASIPMLLSSTWGKSLVLSFINGKIPGKVSIENLELNWLGTQSIKQFELKNSKGVAIVSMDQLIVDSPLYSFLIEPINAGHLKINGLKAEIQQNAMGQTNLEIALGLKPEADQKYNAPVFIENVNAEIKSSSDRNFFIKAVGITRQNDLKGQFSIDATLGQVQKINLHAQHFPVLVLDQTLSIQQPKLSGMLLNLLGDYLDVTIDQISKGNDLTLTLNAKSPYVSSELNGKLDSTALYVNPGSMLRFEIPEQNIDKILTIGQVQNAPKLEQPLKGNLTIDSLIVPVQMHDLNEVIGRTLLTIDSNRISLPGKDAIITLTKLLLRLEAPKQSPTINFTLLADALQNKQPLSMNLEFKIPRNTKLAQLPESLFQNGIAIKGQFNATHDVLEPVLGQQLTVDINGTLKETDSLLTLGLETQQLSIPEISLSFDKLPLSELYRGQTLNTDLSGVITLKKPNWILAKDTPFAAISEITIPWSVSPSSNALKLSFTGIKETGQPKENVAGTIRLENWKNDTGIDFNEANIHAHLKLNAFDTTALQAVLPNHPIATVIGKNVNAEVTAIRDENGNIHGGLDLSDPTKGEGFIKSLSGKFALQNNNSDVTFEVNTKQTIGKTYLAGTFHNLWDNSGKFQLDLDSFSLKGELKHFPVALVTQFATGDQELAKQAEAVLGTQVDADLNAEIKGHNGPVNVKVVGQNGQMQFQGNIQKGVLYLAEPLTASVKVTPQLEKLVLREMFPFLSSVTSSEQPIQLTISNEGFALPIQPFSLAAIVAPSARLDLDKMQFNRDGQLGKVVSLLNVNANNFQVWFTPIFFSFQQGLLTIYRTDMLIANSYPLATWGTVDFNNDKLRLVIGVSAKALQSAFKLIGLDDDYFLQIPLRGTVNKPQLDTAKVATRISALVAASTVTPQGLILGTVLDAASGSFTEDRVPEPTTKPLPWDTSTTKSDDKKESSGPQQIIEKPIKELKKGAKTLIKGLLGG